ncbi:MAG: TfoX/Sxy family DNA transformation protein [Sedimentisphaerales bacterium]|nr:TfoX/Sxy family DNA transformation protein [Sedimentisphaerales bacterium]
MKNTASRQLEEIPGVGKNIARTLGEIGIRRVSDLEGADPEKLYRKLCRYKAGPVDRCMLYVLRCAVYYASNDSHDPKLLKWWNFKDSK